MGQDSGRPIARVGLAMTVAIALAGCELPEQAGGENWAGPTITPRGQEHYPARARRDGVDGWAALACTAGPAQEVRNCRPVAETPAGWGFAEAALGMTGQARIISAQGPLPAPGQEFFMPIYFCFGSGGRCSDDLHRAAADFIRQANSAQLLARQHRCPEAIVAAGKLEQPLLSRYIDALCPAGRPV